MAEDNETIEQEEVNPLEMSDQDFLDNPIPDDIPSETETPEEPNIEVPQEEEKPEEPTEKEPETVTTTTEEEPPAEKSEGEPEEKPEGEPETKEEEKEVDFTSIGKQVMEGFKANGKQMQMKSAEDVIALMQMGANYQKKMRGMKPALKTLKLLEKNGLVDTDKINYLIDLHNKNPEAITQLLKDSGMDPLDIDVTKDSNYTPEDQSISDTEMELETVLEGIQDSPMYDNTLNVITKSWDDASRVAITTKPDIITTINGHMENGIYDKVTQAVEYERSLGRLAGVSDIEAYSQMGNILEAQGLLSPSAPAAPQPDQTIPNSPAAQKQEADRKEQKKAASPTRNKSTVTAKKDYNPLEMSDEDFLKFDKKLAKTG